jgi:Patatin-like phospholipase
VTNPVPTKWADDGAFHVGINMAGAVSAGAYTAGVLDFITEALEQWYAAKASGDQSVPLHDVSIDVFSGASAGGMCAAIAAVMVQGSFEHIRDSASAPLQGSTNRFFESWVNKIDIEYLLQDTDLSDANRPVVSLLDSTIIDQIADYAIAPVPVVTRPYISRALTLFLTLTNVRGTPFSLNGCATGSAEEEIGYYADRLQFETVIGDNPTLSPFAKPLPAGSNGGAWPLLKQAAKATGAFPLFLAPRQIQRSVADYLHSPWEPLSVVNPAPVPPHWTLRADETVTTLNVDGGVTNNDPFQLAHDFLATRNPSAKPDPQTGTLRNPSGAEDANCGVLTVAPFPAKALYDPDYPFEQNSSVFGMLPNLFATLVSQSRFLGESLTAVMSGNSFSRFVLAPSDTDNPDKDALQCGLLSAFGGFFERSFRLHDYQLGRRNCQKFLRDHFQLAVTNPIVATGLNRHTAEGREAVKSRFDPRQQGWLPIIPLCGTAETEVPEPKPGTISSARVGHIVNWIVDRLHSISKPLIGSVIDSELEAWAARSALHTLISTWGRRKINDFIRNELSEVIAD